MGVPMVQSDFVINEESSLMGSNSWLISILKLGKCGLRMVKYQHNSGQQQHIAIHSIYQYQSMKFDHPAIHLVDLCRWFKTICLTNSLTVFNSKLHILHFRGAQLAWSSLMWMLYISRLLIPFWRHTTQRIVLVFIFHWWISLVKCSTNLTVVPNTRPQHLQIGSMSKCFLSKCSQYLDMLSRVLSQKLHCILCFRSMWSSKCDDDPNFWTQYRHE